MKLLYRKPKVWSFLHFTRYMAISPAIKAEFEKRIALRVIAGYSLAAVVLFTILLLKG